MAGTQTGVRVSNPARLLAAAGGENRHARLPLGAVVSPTLVAVLNKNAKVVANAGGSTW